MANWASAWVSAALLACALGCAGERASKARADDLERRLEAMREDAAEEHRRVEDLSNRVLLLEERAASERTSAERTGLPRLPVVRLHADGTTSTTTTRSEGGPRTVASAPPPRAAGEGLPASVVEQPEDVEYAGEALSTSASRPVLRLQGNQRPAPAQPPRTREGEAAPPAIHVPGGVAGGVPGSERLRVAALPDRGVSQVVAQEAAAETLGSPMAVEAVPIYRAALAALTHKRHSQAIEEFRRLVREFPAHELADNAQYWVGEAYYDQKDYKTASEEFRKVVEGYPSGNKVPDALLKLAFCCDRLGDQRGMRDALLQVVDNYPKSDAARLARARLTGSR
jgi:tol-pal system protein YbgF